MYRLQFKLEAATATEANNATILVKEFLEPHFGVVKTITVEEWLYQEFQKPLEPFREINRYAQDSPPSRSDRHRRRI